MPSKDSELPSWTLGVWTQRPVVAPAGLGPRIPTVASLDELQGCAEAVARRVVQPGRDRGIPLRQGVGGLMAESFHETSETCRGAEFRYTAVCASGVAHV